MCSLLCQWRAQVREPEIVTLPDWAAGSAVLVAWNERDLVFPDMLFFFDGRLGQTKKTSRHTYSKQHPKYTAYTYKNKTAILIII